MKDRSKHPLNGEQKAFVQAVRQQLDSVQTIFHPYMVDIVSNTICADYMDYVRRDTANAGLDRQTDDRILSQFLVGTYDVGEGTTQLRMALLLSDSRGKPRLDACTGVVDLVRKRFRLAEIIYYHKTKVSASAMLAKALSLIGTPPEVPDRPDLQLNAARAKTHAQDIAAGKTSVSQLREQYSASALLSPEIGDESLLIWLQDWAWSRAAELEKKAVLTAPKLAPSHAAEDGLEPLLRGIGLLKLLVRRQLYKVCGEINAEGVTHLTRISDANGQPNPEQLERKIDEVLRLRKANGPMERRSMLEADMAHAAGWPTDSILIYVPPRKSQAKGIETRALSGGTLVTLGEHPAVSAEVQTLNTQYKRLWRVILLVHPDFQHDDLGLSRAMDTFLRSVWDINLDMVAGEIKDVARFSYIPESQRHGATLFKALCDSVSPKWETYLSAPRAVREDVTITPHEQAYRAYLMTLDDGTASCAERLRERYPDSGDLEKRVPEHTETAPGNLENVRSLLKAIHQELTAGSVAGSEPDGETTGRDFEAEARAIVRLYIPAEERRQLRPRYREFIQRNRQRTGRERHRVLKRLREYDISKVANFTPYFNREDDPLTAEKLKAIEEDTSVLEITPDDELERS